MRTDPGLHLLGAVALGVVLMGTACETTKGEQVSTSSSATSSLPAAIRVEANDQGFTPSRVQVTANQPTRLTFRRTSDGTCATSVVFPDLKLERELPKDQDVTIELPAMATGRDVTFQCGMGMYKSKVVAR